jgi:hypothetical protein
MNEFAFVMYGSVFNKALMQSKINIIMMLCIDEEKWLVLNQISAHTTLSAQSLSCSTIPTLNVTPIALQFETKLSSLVTFKKEEQIPQGVADYTLCYDGDEQMGTNLILMEAKKKGLFLGWKVSWWRTWVSNLSALHPLFIFSSIHF